MRIWAEYGARIRSINQPTSLISSENQYAIVTQKIGYFAGACAPFWRQGPAKLDAKPQQYYPMVVVGPPLCCWCMDSGGNAITMRPSWFGPLWGDKKKRDFVRFDFVPSEGTKSGLRIRTTLPLVVRYLQKRDTLYAKCMNLLCKVYEW